MPKKDNYKEITNLLLSLKRKHPSYGFGKHISLAFSEYGDIWGITDKEALFALEKYSTELDLDGDKIASPTYIEELMKDVEDFDNILNEEEDD